MSEHQILYSEEMILAKLAGRKTVTRRPVKNAPDVILDVQKRDALGGYGPGEEVKMLKEIYEVKCPYGTPGDRLWTKENFKIEYGITLQVETQLAVQYKADQQLLKPVLTNKEWAKYKQWKQPTGPKSKLHMFRSLSRFLDEITEITVERVQDITENEAIAEGIYLDNELKKYAAGPDAFSLANSPKRSFKLLWQSMYQGGEFDWHNNPWVWVVRYTPLAVNKAENQNMKNV